MASSHCRPPCQPEPFHHSPLTRFLTPTWAAVTPTSSAAAAPTATAPSGWTDKSVGRTSATVGSAPSGTAESRSTRSPVLADQLPAASPARPCTQYDPPAAPPVNENEKLLVFAPGDATVASIHCRPACQPEPVHHSPLTRFFIGRPGPRSRRCRRCPTRPPPPRPTGSTAPDAGAVSTTVGLTVSPPDEVEAQPGAGGPVARRIAGAPLHPVRPARRTTGEREREIAGLRARRCHRRVDPLQARLPAGTGPPQPADPVLHRRPGPRSRRCRRCPTRPPPPGRPAAPRPTPAPSAPRSD